MNPELREKAGKSTRPALLVVAMAAVFAPLRSEAGPASLDKSGFHLFKPVPRELLREMSTDRPDQTESPYTVDAGHVQAEMDLVNYVRDHDGSHGADSLSETWYAAPLNFKIGLLNQVDAQFVIDTHVESRSEDRAAGTVTRASGFGDFQTRLKVNLWGNDGGNTALALMPFVKWPLPASDLRNGKTEGGLIVPFSLGLGEHWSVTFMTEVDFVRNTTNTGHDMQFVNSVSLAHDLTEKLGVYVEFFSAVRTEESGEWQGQADVGFTYGLTENVQFDLGCNFGATDSAPDFNPFLGLSMRY
jgi:hypothetical protein